MLSVDRVSLHIQDRIILSNLNFMLKEKSFVGLLGPNGAGKTTLLKTVCGLLSPTEGHICVRGEDLRSFTPHQRGQSFAYMPQDHGSAWPLRVYDIVALGRLPHLSPLSSLSDEDEGIIENVLLATRTYEFINRPLNTLSGGEKNRVFLARALAVQAPVLLCDEPVSGLDPYHQITMMELLRHEAKQGKLVIAALHDLALAARFCDHLFLLKEGEIYVEGHPRDVLSDEHIKEVYHIKTARLQGMPIPLERL